MNGMEVVKDSFGFNTFHQKCHLVQCAILEPKECHLKNSVVFKNKFRKGWGGVLTYACEKSFSQSAHLWKHI